MKLIGITGKARSGKDTIADYLMQEKWFDTISFAAPIKRGIQAAFNLQSDEPGEDREAIIPHLGVSKRYLYQTFGTEYGRNLIRDDIWIVMAQQTLDKIHHREMTNPGLFTDTPGVVISDVRFDNEAEFIKRNNGVIIHVERENAAAVNQHVSEAGIDPQHIDFYINNNGTLEQLYDRVDEILGELKCKNC